MSAWMPLAVVRRTEKQEWKEQQTKCCHGCGWTSSHTAGGRAKWHRSPGKHFGIFLSHQTQPWNRHSGILGHLSQRNPNLAPHTASGSVILSCFLDTFCISSQICLYVLVKTSLSTAALLLPHEKVAHSWSLSVPHPWTYSSFVPTHLSL